MTIQHLTFGLLCAALGTAGVLYQSELRLPGNNQGYEPEQPLAFSHRLHAGELSIRCEYCHYGARQSRNAGVPSESICMNCHKVVSSGFDALITEKVTASAESREPRRIVSTELQKLYDALALDAKGEPIEGGERAPIEWVRVHNLPDFVYFDHRPHVARQIACETCHGPVGTMDRMRQESTLSMGWCIDCHRANAIGRSDIHGPTEARLPDHVSTNCVTCHL